MKFQDKLQKQTREQIWQEYCGFFDLNISDYMYIQNRLMEEQLQLWRNSGLGRELLKGKYPKTFNELRKMLPLTKYEDYADVLLARRAEMLPGEPIVWIQTTWEGGLRPIKLAPYTRGMLDAYKHNVISVAMLASSRGKGDFNVSRKDRVLYGGAPLPYVTGLIPSLVAEEIDFEWLPDSNKNSELSFSQRIKKGFQMAMSGGVDYFFAIGSVANYITENFSKGGSGGSLSHVSFSVAAKYLKAKYISKRDGRKVTPGDVFDLKGFVCTGNDAKCYREALTKAWGVEPIELAAGTESTCIATETWEHNGMVFFPDACFYEFIPEAEMLRNIANPSYTPRTCLMDEVIAGETYELVISVLHGGAFMRYRIGDTYRCLSSCVNGMLPRFTYLDRVPNVIDIAGFTRITEQSINEVVRLSKLGVRDWFAKKEFNSKGIPYLHMYVEVDPDSSTLDVVKRQVLTEHMAVYFRYFDSDYNDLKKLLNMEPLFITILKSGTIANFKQTTKRQLLRINPSSIDVAELLRLAGLEREEVANT